MPLASSSRKATARPVGVTALGAFFAAGAVISLTSSVSLAAPGSFLDPMWRLNPRAGEAFAKMGAWAVVLLGVVCLACALSAIGFFRGDRRGYRLAVGLIAVNLAGDVVSVLTGTEPRAAFGIPIAAGILVFLASRRVRRFFDLIRVET